MRSRKAGIPRDVAALRPAGLRLWARHVGSAFRRCLDGGCSAGPGPERRGSERINGIAAAAAAADVRGMVFPFRSSRS